MLELDFRNFRKITAPRVFSIVDNPEEFVQFLHLIKESFVSGQKVFIDMDNVETITDESIVILLSNMVRFREEGIAFNGSKPLNPTVRRKLVASGFFGILYSKDGANKISVKSMNSTIFTHAYKGVDSVMAGQLVLAASRFIWGKEHRCPGVKNTLTELMSNTFKHSSASNQNHHWWMSMAKDSGSKVVTFGFVDYGVGVFRSLRNKRPDEEMYGALKRLLMRFPRIQNDADTMRLILQGELHRTSTGKKNRGQGLPSLYSSLQRNDLDNLVIISNNVYVNVKKEKYLMLDNEFLGTFVSWEMNPQINKLENN